MLLLSRVVAGASPDVEDAALAIAADAIPALSVEGSREHFDMLADGVRNRLSPGDGPVERAKALCDFMFRVHGFHGSDAYDDPRDNYLNEVLQRRTGSPVALAVLLIAVGRRAGVLVEPIAYPGHFLVRVEGMYTDPFDGSRPIEAAALLALAQETLGDARQAERSMEPVGARAIAVRLLLNLQRIHHKRGDHARSLVVCDRLFEMTTAAFYRADRGAHALALGATRAAINDFEAYLAAHPQAPDREYVLQLIESAGQLMTPLN